jgi:spore coat polysaccharide biosynthesis protein SpsF (cytidylyltransferase family)
MKINTYTGIIIQARTDSNRLPNKVLLKIEGKPLIWHVFNRVRKIKKVDRLILATTNRSKDKRLINFAQKNKIDYFGGSSKNVLDRFYQCAKSYNLDIIIRITADCPLIDPGLIEEMLNFFKKKKFDYVSNTIEPTYPDGLDVEVFSFKSLKKTWLNAKKNSEKEHVTSFIKNNPKQFKIFNYKNNIDLSNFRWTVDQKEDLVFVRKVYRFMNPKKKFDMKFILHKLEKNPNILKINDGIKRNEGYQKSVLLDK